MEKKELTPLVIEKAVFQIFRENFMGTYSGKYREDQANIYLLEQRVAELLQSQDYHGVDDNHKLKGISLEYLFEVMWKLVSIGVVYPKTFHPADQPTLFNPSQHFKEVSTEQDYFPEDSDAFISNILDTNPFIDEYLSIF